MKLLNKFLTIVISVVIIYPLYAENSYAFIGVAKNVPELSIKAIKSLAITGKTKGSVSVAKELTELANSIPASQRARFFECAYAKILVEQKRITQIQADEFIKNLSSIPGFRNTLSKMVGINDNKYIGHLFELRMANQLKKSGYDVLSIGERYNDTIKITATDIDIVAQKGSRGFAFELKNYNPVNISYKEVNSFEQDMQTLKIYSSEHSNVTPIFLSKNAPEDKTIKNILDAYGKKNGVKVLYGEPEIAVQVLEAIK